MAGEKSPIEYIDDNKVLNKTGLLELSGQIKGYINTNMPQSYTLPTATTSTLGGVKVDGETITINDGVISATTSGGGSSYTFTNGLTESNGTVSWDLNDGIKKSPSWSSSIGIACGGSPNISAPSSVLMCYRPNESQPYIFGQNSVSIGPGHNVFGALNFVQGSSCETRNDNTIAMGQSLIAYKAQFVEGKYNKQDNKGIFQHIIGNGTASNNRSNAMAIDWSGNEYLAGNLYVGCNDFTTTSNGLTTAGCGGSKVATESYVDTAIANAGGGGGTTYTAGTGISIVNGVISLDLATAEEGEF